MMAHRLLAYLAAGMPKEPAPLMIHKMKSIIRSADLRAFPVCGD